MLEINNLTKTFGSLKAVTNESFHVEQGHILGLIGQNGAGKTTTFRMILNFLTPDTGTITWQGQPLTRKEADIIGYLPEERGLYPKMSIEDQILFFAELKGKKRKDIRPKIDAWMDRFQVKGKRTDKVKSLSKGNQQKVQLIATLIHEPDLIILDEPFSGLDPVNASLLEQGIKGMRDRGAAIIYSSHDMGNVSAISDDIVMLKQGQVVLNGAVDTIRESFGQTRVFLQSPLTEAEVQAIPGVQAVTRKGQRLTITLSDPEAGKTIFTAATKQGYIREFSQQPPTLDEIFRLKAGAANE
ncbi:ABC transporter ATP-binding protein [Agrilactobacillus fermenti]|uniref:ABC transporter ATP-binding protein n=1 Tax=Agrilactobacillus fermenti TaxID=2586909 RepID=UPI001E615645|nr:ABC transporter ATP-binding protein [Agrilactobacillus fermenti]MCD2255634.1 ABC transporter ATP-binding protein [Agrilactobacillus fermenti]